jgi:hypothetical protein
MDRLTKEVTAKKKVLLLGIDPQFIDYSKLPPAAPGRTPGQIRKTSVEVTQKLEGMGYEVHNCIVDAGATAGKVLSDLLETEKFECIMVGGGIRGILQHNLLFEKLMNIIHRKAVDSKICFNTGPETTVEAVLRWVDEPVNQ